MGYQTSGNTLDFSYCQLHVKPSVNTFCGLYLPHSESYSWTKTMQHLKLHWSIDPSLLLDPPLPVPFSLPLPVTTSGLQQRASSSQTCFHGERRRLLHRGRKKTQLKHIINKHPHMNSDGKYTDASNSPVRDGALCKWLCMEQTGPSWCSTPDQSPRLKNRMFLCWHGVVKQTFTS